MLLHRSYIDLQHGISFLLYVGISSSLTKILKEKTRAEDSDTEQPFTSPAKCYKKSRKRVIVDDFDRDAIRREIYKIYEKRSTFHFSSLLVWL